MGEGKEGFQREGWSQLSLTTHNNITFEMDDKRKYFDGVNAVRKGRKKGDVLRLCIHPRNVVVCCSVCGSPCKLGATGKSRAERSSFGLARFRLGFFFLYFFLARLSYHEPTRHLLATLSGKIGTKLTRRFLHRALDNGVIVLLVSCFS
jgi:hypothetical protein